MCSENKDFFNDIENELRKLEDISMRTRNSVSFNEEHQEKLQQREIIINKIKKQLENIDAYYEFMYRED